MIKIDRRVAANGSARTQVRVVEGYRPGPGLAPKQRTIKDFGCIEDQADPKAFMAMVRRFNADCMAADRSLRNAMAKKSKKRSVK